MIANEEKEEKTVNEEVENGSNPEGTKHLFSFEFETIGNRVPTILCEEEEETEKNPLWECE